MVWNNKDLQAAATDARKRVAVVEQSCHRLGIDLEMAQKRNKTLSESLEGAKEMHSIEVRRLHKQIQELGGSKGESEGDGTAHLRLHILSFLRNISRAIH